MAELDDAIYDVVKARAAAGDELADAGRYREAIEEYNQAFQVIPEPKHDWSASTWLLAAVADAAFLGGFYTTAREALDVAMHCPDAIGNPFLHLRRGEVLFEKDELDGAADELMRAYMGGGPEIFDDEDDKYLDFLRTRAIIP